MANKSHVGCRPIVSSIIACDLCHAKRGLMIIVVVIPKEGLAGLYDGPDVMFSYIYSLMYDEFDGSVAIFFTHILSPFLSVIQYNSVVGVTPKEDLAGWYQLAFFWYDNDKDPSGQF